MHTSIAHQGFSFRSWVTMGKTLPWNAFSQSTKTVPSNRHMPVNGLSGSPIPILKQYDGELYTWIWLKPLGVNFPFVISLDSRVISTLVSAHSYPKYSIATQVWTCHSNDVTENDEYTEKPGDSPYLEITLCCLFLSWQAKNLANVHYITFFYLLLNNSELFLWYQPTLSDITVNSMPMQMMVAKQFEL